MRSRGEQEGGGWSYGPTPPWRVAERRSPALAGITVRLNASRAILFAPLHSSSARERQGLIALFIAPLVTKEDTTKHAACQCCVCIILRVLAYFWSMTLRSSSIIRR